MNLGGTGTFSPQHTATQRSSLSTRRPRGAGEHGTQAGCVFGGVGMRVQAGPEDLTPTPTRLQTFSALEMQKTTSELRPLRLYVDGPLALSCPARARGGSSFCSVICLRGPSHCSDGEWGGGEAQKGRAESPKAEKTESLPEQRETGIQEASALLSALGLHGTDGGGYL